MKTTKSTSHSVRGHFRRGHTGKLIAVRSHGRRMVLARRKKA